MSQGGAKAGLAKGLRTVVEERFGEESVKGQQFLSILVFHENFQFSLGKRQDRLVEMLEKEEDFSSSQTLLEEELEKLGAFCIFTPKFHPELNPIESCYR